MTLETDRKYNVTIQNRIVTLAVVAQTKLSQYDIIRFRTVILASDTKEGVTIQNRIVTFVVVTKTNVTIRIRIVTQAIYI